MVTTLALYGFPLYYEYVISKKHLLPDAYKTSVLKTKIPHGKLRGMDPGFPSNFRVIRGKFVF
jgi:hypothetical protein